MKKRKKFRTFPILNVKAVLLCLTSLIIFLAAVSAPMLFIRGNFNTEFVKIMLHIGTNRPYTPPETNIAKTLLTISVPTIVFENNPSTPKAEPLVLSEPVEAETTPVLENTAQKITYKSAEEKGYTSTDGIYINNQTSKSINIQNLINKDLNISITDEPLVLIVHTHTTESYTPSENYNYTPTETDRTTDLDFNMAAVGEVICNQLIQNGINTIHDTTINDYPSYSQSYSKSLKLVESYIKKYPSIKIVIDVHRDAIVTQSGAKMRPVASLDTPCAQVMMVVGTNDSGLSHSNWQTNLSFALKMQHKMNSMYPTLARPINLRRERFNQHTAPYAFILEVGTNGNTLDEAKEGAKLFSEALVSLLKV